jgi:hypothetical protein
MRASRCPQDLDAPTNDPQGVTDTSGVVLRLLTITALAGQCEGLDHWVGTF